MPLPMEPPMKPPMKSPMKQPITPGSALFLLVAALLSWGCTETPAPTPDAASDATLSAAGPPPGRAGMVNTANPHATEAGAAMLRRGGSAVDAAIAAHAVLGLVEPQSSGIGGGAFMLAFDAERGDVEVIDGRETAPAGARPDMFLADDGTPLSHRDRIQSGHSVGVPGAIALYRTAHDRHGRLPWATLFEPAIRLAETGFEVSPRLHDLLVRMADYTNIDENPDTSTYFFPDGEALPIGYLRTNADYAATLRGVAERGPAAFYTGPVARSMVARAALPPRGGTLTEADLASYQVAVREPVCAPFRALRVCSAPPPSSGLAVLQILGLVERFAPMGFEDDVDGWSAFIDAMLLAYADRDHYVGDGDFVAVPVADLLAPAYLDARAADRPTPGALPSAGDPGAVLRGEPLIDRWGRDTTEEVPGTSHLSVVDSDGNAVSMTASVEFVFGSQRLASGFILNNELTDFSSLPELNGKPVANAVEPGKRPRSSMTPTMVFDANGDLVLATGSPGGNSIIAYTSKSILAILDGGMDVATGIALPNVVARGHPVRVETERAADGFIEALRARGYPIEESDGENSGLHPILVTPAGLEGAADPRREGVATRVVATDG